MDSVRTRFAPSPTGELHIGGVRTALFNWLFARHHGGQFILRIDDTDRERHQEETVAPILDGFRWLGIDWDEGPGVGGPHEPYYQSDRRSLYVDWATRLEDAGFLYRDYSTAEERAADKSDADSRKVAYRFRERHYNDEEKEGRSWCLRFRVPLGRTIEIDDMVRGKVSWNTDEIADFVVMRQDGSPLYSFATVVDDVDMSISHVIRSEEHLANTFPQFLLFEAMGFAPPRFAHLPYVASPGTKRKMSKRDGGAGLNEYIGEYLPETMINYLAHLGWSLDGTTEILDREKLIEHFNLERVVHSPASHDPDKLYWFQGEWMKTKSVQERAEFAMMSLLENGLITKPFDEAQTQRFLKIVEIAGDRLKKASDICRVAGFFFLDHIVYDMEAVQNRLCKEGVDEILAAARKLFDSIPAEDFKAANLDAAFHEVIERENFASGVAVNAVRVATTGVAIGPGLYDTLEILGKDEVVFRIDHTIEHNFWGNFK